MTTRAQWIKEATPFITKPKLIQDAPTWIIELAARYGRLANAKGLRTQTEFKMHALCSALDVMGVKQISDVWQYMVVHEHEEAREAKRALPKEPVPNVAKSNRPKACDVVFQLLSEKPVRTDTAIIAAVNAATFHDGFNAKQLAYYKSKFRRGLMKGQGGKPVAIEEQTVGKQLVHGGD